MGLSEMVSSFFISKIERGERITITLSLNNHLKYF